MNYANTLAHILVGLSLGVTVGYLIATRRWSKEFDKLDSRINAIEQETTVARIMQKSKQEVH